MALLGFSVGRETLSLVYIPVTSQLNVILNAKTPKRDYPAQPNLLRHSDIAFHSRSDATATLCEVFRGGGVGGSHVTAQLTEMLKGFRG